MIYYLLSYPILMTHWPSAFLFTEIEIMSKDSDVIDVTDLTNEEFVEHMRELDRQSRCPCVGCEKCAVRMQRHECQDYQRWVHRYVING